MSFIQDIVNGVTGNLVTDLSKWIARKTGNTKLVRHVEKHLNPDQLHPATQALLAEALAEGLTDLQGIDPAAWQPIFAHPEHRLQLIGWVLEWHEEYKPNLGEWSLEHAPNPELLRGLLLRLHRSIQEKKRKYFPPEFFNLLGNQIATLGAINDLGQRLDEVLRQINALLKLPRSVAPLSNARYPLSRAAMRQLLSEAFTPDDFLDFCRDHFHEVYRNFTPSQDQSHRVRLLLDYVATRGQEDDLLTKIQAARPSKYTEFAPSLWASSPGAGSHIENVPYRHLPCLFGRDSVIEALHAAWAAEQEPARPQVLYGLPGIGKTQIAIEYVYRYGREYDFVRWIRAAEAETLRDDYAALAIRVGVPPSATDEQKVTAVRTWLAAQRARWLLVFDDARQPNVVWDYLPHRITGHMLITSSNSIDWSACGWATPLEVPLLEPADAVGFLQQRTEHSAAATALALVEALGCLPLALEQAGAYIKAHQSTPAAYLDLFQSCRAELLGRGTPTSYRGTVVTTWELALQQVQRTQPAGVDLLHLCAFLAPDEIPCAEVCAAISTNPVVRDEAVAVARSYSLLKASSRTLAMHGLVQDVVRSRLAAVDCQRWAAIAVQLMAKLFPAEADVLSEMQTQTWSLCERLLPHALRAIEHAERLNVAPEATGRLWHQVGVYYRCKARFPAARTAFKQAHTLLAQVLGRRDPAVAHSLNELAELSEIQGQYKEGEKLVRQARSLLQPGVRGWLQRIVSTLPIRNRFARILGPGSPEVAETVAESEYILGMIYANQGYYAKAADCYQRAVTIRQDLFGAENLLVAQGLNNQANLYTTLERYSEAKSLHHKALAIRRRFLVPTHPAIAESLHNLAVLYGAQDQYVCAERYCQDALAIRQQALGAEHPEVAFSCNTLGRLAALQKQYSKAECCYSRAQAIWSQTLGADHRNVARVLLNLAQLYGRQEKWEQAEAYVDQALKIWAKQLPLPSTDLAQSYAHLAQLYGRQEKWEQAEDYYEQALAIWKTQLGRRHLHVAQGYYHLAQLYGRWGNWAKAKHFSYKALAIWKTQLGRRHPRVAQGYYHLARLYERRHKYRAKHFYQQTLAIWESQLGPQHPFTVQAQQRYAALLQQLNRNAVIRP